MEANNDHKIDGLPALTKLCSDKQNATITSNLDYNKPSPLPTQQHGNNDNNNNMMLHQQPQAPHQQTPLDAEAQQIVQREALNDKLFLTWLQQKHPDAFLCHVKRTGD